MTDPHVVLALDADSTVPPYEQVRAQLTGRIRSGELAPGTRLPTVRALADALGLAVNTVARAYRELEQAGLVVTRGRLGTTVEAAGAEDRAALAAATVYVRQARALGLTDEDALAWVRTALASG